MVEKPQNWKDMAGHSSMLAAVRAQEVQLLLETGKALLAKIPAHWHDDATTDFRDAVAEVEKRQSRTSPPDFHDIVPRNSGDEWADELARRAEAEGGAQ